jgi:hypothetical protein
VLTHRFRYECCEDEADPVPGAPEFSAPLLKSPDSAPDEVPVLEFR